MSKAELHIDGKKIELPIVEGSEEGKAIDISGIHARNGIITIDPGYSNTGSCKSAVAYVDGERGILNYRGYPIDQLARKSTFVETSFLLIYGHLPTADELSAFREKLVKNSLLHEDMLHFYDGYPTTAHPMGILSSMVCSLSSYYPDFLDPSNPEHVECLIPRVLSKIRTIAAFAYKKSIGQPVIYPCNSLDYCANFMNMMFAVPSEKYDIDPEIVKALNALLILHADNEQNCSTSTVRMVGSSDANLFASIAAGICALWGPKHGGANQKVVEMLQYIKDNNLNVKTLVAQAKDKNSGFRLMGFGHRVYKSYDPRAKVIKDMSRDLLAKLNRSDPLLDIAQELEAIALEDDYFIERKLYPNVDFYSGITYRAIGIPLNMFTVMFAIGRMPGWIAHWKEMHESSDNRIGRPRQVYTGSRVRDFVPIEQR
ncbi:MAG: citrate synthase [Pseudomonadota bacterium]|nr:citrate synthase [Pseudomonadota bacterium]